MQLDNVLSTTIEVIVNCNFLKFLEDISPFCATTDTPGLLATEVFHILSDLPELY